MHPPRPWRDSFPTVLSWLELLWWLTMSKSGRGADHGRFLACRTAASGCRLGVFCTAKSKGDRLAEGSAGGAGGPPARTRPTTRLCRDTCRSIHGKGREAAKPLRLKASSRADVSDPQYQPKATPSVNHERPFGTAWLCRDARASTHPAPRTAAPDATLGSRYRIAQSKWDCTKIIKVYAYTS